MIALLITSIPRVILTDCWSALITLRQLCVLAKWLKRRAYERLFANECLISFIIRPHRQSGLLLFIENNAIVFVTCVTFIQRTMCNGDISAYWPCQLFSWQSRTRIWFWPLLAPRFAVKSFCRLVNISSDYLHATIRLTLFKVSQMQFSIIIHPELCDNGN